MPRSISQFRTFIASTGDLAAERIVVREAISEVNKTLRNSLVEIEVLEGWTDTIPDVGEYAQAVVNSQLLNDIDIFICLMGTRVGSPTAVAESGTIEEWQTAFRLRNTNNQNLRMMLYFKDAPIRPSEINLEELSRVRSFQNAASDDGAHYAKFESSEELARLIRINLHGVVAAPSSIPGTQLTEIKYQLNDVIGENTDFVEFSADEEEDGLFDYLADAEGGFDELILVMQRITDAVVDVGDQFTQRSLEVDALAKNATSNEKRVVINRAAENLDGFVNRVSGDVDTFGRLVDSSLDGVIKALEISRQHMSQENGEGAEGKFLSESSEFAEVISNLLLGMGEPISAIEGLRDAIANSGRFTKNYNKSKRATVILLERYLTNIRVMVNLLENLLNSLRAGTGSTAR